MKDFRSVLNGEKLSPTFSSVPNGTGFNLKKFMQDPPARLDLILWFNGGNNPYLENGTVVDEASWNRAQRVFGGDFLGFAVWFN
jgi:hypothetical protein